MVVVPAAQYLPITGNRPYSRDISLIDPGVDSGWKYKEGRVYQITVAVGDIEKAIIILLIAYLKATFDHLFSVFIPLNISV